MNDLMREKFEEYADEKGFDLSFYFFDDDKSYSNGDTRLAFEIYSNSWQASRDAEIELPTSSEIAVSQDTVHLTVMDYTLEKCKEAIKSSGYKVKE